MHPMNKITLRCAVLAIASVASTSQAQTAPDAGQTLQQLKQQPPAPPRESPPLTIPSPGAPESTLPGGAQVEVRRIEVTGNTAISRDKLDQILASAVGQSYDLAGLRGLTDRLSTFYREAGYPFARAYLPPQDMKDGVLRIDLIEGRYGAVKAQSADPALAGQAQKFLHALQSGQVIQDRPLERTILLLDDLPGIQTTPVIRPGQQTGTGDLDIGVTLNDRINGDVGLDNYGNRYSGYHRVRANVNWNSPFTLGDQISVRALLSDHSLWLGSLAYSAPLGYGGLRGNVGYALTSYELGREFANLEANGTAAVSTVGLSYPLVRSQPTSVNLSLSYQHKALQDNKDSTNTRESKFSNSVPLTLQFDHRDALGGGGITYGGLTWTAGILKLDSALAAADANGTRGAFNKLNVDLVRLQSLPQSFSLSARWSQQIATQNLDSSERMSLGGANGVRAYPTGEGTGDEGWLAQIELRYSAGNISPYVFYDHGSIKTMAHPVSSTSSNARDLSGIGLGARYQQGGWSLDATLAWRSQGGAPQSDPVGDSSPRAWLTVGYRF